MTTASDAAKKLEEKWRTFYEDARRPSRCIFCDAKVRIWFNGTRLRSATVLLQGEAVRLVDVPCRRVRCSRCRQSWTLRPPGLCPNRHFQRCVVAYAMSSRLFDEHCSARQAARMADCTRQTIGRWSVLLAALASPEELAYCALEVSGAPITQELPEARGVEHKALTQRGRECLRRAAAVLGWFEVLGTTLGSEPPGLRGILEVVIHDRPDMALDRQPRIPDLVLRHALGAATSIPM